MTQQKNQTILRSHLIQPYPSFMHPYIYMQASFWKDTIYRGNWSCWLYILENALVHLHCRAFGAFFFFLFLANEKMICVFIGLHIKKMWRILENSEADFLLTSTFPQLILSTLRQPRLWLHPPTRFATAPISRSSSSHGTGFLARFRQLRGTSSEDSSSWTSPWTF